MSEFDLGRHEAMLDGLDSRMSGVETKVDGVDKKLDSVLQYIAEKRGERRMLVAIAGLAGAAASVVVTVFKLIVGRP